MNVTDGLRFKLDDLGVEWTVPDESWNQSCITYWTVGGIKWVAFESENNTLLLNASSISDLTPEQAIAATLGVETCHLEEIDKECDTASEYMINREWCFDAVYRCSCGCRFGHAAHDRPRYCPNCGRRCVVGVMA